VIGLFPPLKRPADIPAGTSGALGSRAFLLSEEYLFSTNLGEQRVGKAGADIDPGRLFAEALVILSAASIGLITLMKLGARHAEQFATPDRGRR
jgi:hypothetical protein